MKLLLTILITLSMFFEVPGEPFIEVDKSEHPIFIESIKQKM